MKKILIVFSLFTWMLSNKIQADDDPQSTPFSQQILGAAKQCLEWTAQEMLKIRGDVVEKFPHPVYSTPELIEEEVQAQADIDPSLTIAHAQPTEEDYYEAFPGFLYAMGIADEAPCAIEEPPCAIEEPPCANDCPYPMHHEIILSTRPYFEMADGTEIGVDQSYATLGLFTSFPTGICNSSSRLWLYNDLSWEHLLKGTNAATVEGGFVWGNDHRSFGGYVGYDWRRWNRNSFNQISAGLHMNYCPWEISLNLNYPLQNEHIICSTVFDYDGGYKALYKDFDATYRIVSVNVARSFCTCVPNMEVAVGIEPYFLMAGSKDLCSRGQKAWGGKVRVLINVCGPLNIEASISSDSIFHNRTQIVFGIDLLQFFYSYSSDSRYHLNKTFRRQKLVALKHRESWEYNW